MARMFDHMSMGGGPWPALRPIAASICSRLRSASPAGTKNPSAPFIPTSEREISVKSASS